VSLISPKIKRGHISNHRTGPAGESNVVVVDGTASLEPPHPIAKYAVGFQYWF
jgi:hypothetical protein